MKLQSGEASHQQESSVASSAAETEASNPFVRVGEDGALGCSATALAKCRSVPNAGDCVVHSREWMGCKCDEGYFPDGFNENFKCTAGNPCISRPCKDPEMKCSPSGEKAVCSCERPHFLTSTDGESCIQVDLCSVDSGGCDENADCHNQFGGDVRCECRKGWRNDSGRPGEKCEDINECELLKDAACGGFPFVECVNTAGSYKCVCRPGYFGSAIDGDCHAHNPCIDPDLNDCDPLLATCNDLGDGHHTCTCKEGFSGSGKFGDCFIGEDDDPRRYCEAVGKFCGTYQECRLTEDRMNYFCKTKGKSDSISTFLRRGPTEDTPVWLWAALAITCGIFLLIIIALIVCMWKKYKGKKLREVEEAQMCLTATIASQPNPFAPGNGCAVNGAQMVMPRPSRANLGVMHSMGPGATQGH